MFIPFGYKHLIEDEVFRTQRTGSVRILLILGSLNKVDLGHTASSPCLLLWYPLF
jgi:hypothetical protein